MQYSGAVMRTRTADPHLTMVVLYQLSYNGVIYSVICLGRKQTAILTKLPILLTQFNFYTDLFITMEVLYR
jgi:hypothetical protein